MLKRSLWILLFLAMIVCSADIVFAATVDRSEIITDLKLGNFEQLERNLKENKAKPQDDLDAFSRPVFYLVKPELLGSLDLWCEKYPRSHFAFTARGQFYLSYAWMARGNGWAYTVTDAAAKLFHERVKKAEVDLQKAYALDPTDPAAPTGLIWVAIADGLSREKMEEQFQRAVKADPSYYRAYRAKLNYLMPKWGGSHAGIFTVLDNIVGDPYAGMFDFAQEAAAAPKHSFISMILVEAHLEKFYRMHDRLSLPLPKGAYFSEDEVWSPLEHVFQALLAEFPDSDIVHAFYGIIAFCAGKNDLADQELNRIKDFRKLIRSDINLDYLTSAYAKLNRIDEWIGYLKSFTLENPGERSGIYRILGMVYAEYKKDYATAETYFLQCAGLEPDETYSYISLGRLNAIRKKYDDAVTFFKKAIEINPREEDAYYELAEAYKSAGEVDLAIEYYNKAIQIHPNNNGYAYNGLANVYEQKSMDEEAKDILKQGIQIAPSYPALHYNLARLLGKKGDKAGAIEEYKAAIEQDPSYAMAYNNLGETYGELERYDEATQALEKAVSLDPEGEAGKLARRTLDWIKNNVRNGVFVGQ